MAYEWHIQPTTRQVCSHEHPSLPILEPLIVGQPQFGGYLAMQRATLHALLGESVLDGSGRVHTVAEDDATGVVFARVLTVLFGQELQRL